MLIGIVGDLHIGIKQSSDVMMRHQAKFFTFLFDQLKKLGITTVIQAGDLFDNRRTANFKSLQFAYEQLFDYFENNGIELYSVVGNHDIFFREELTINSSSILLRKYNNIHIFDKCQTLNFDEVNVDFIPWICKQNQQECLDYISNSSSNICIGHFEINQFPVLSQSLFEGGLDPAIFKNYHTVFSGHFHCRSAKDNIVYIGTPYQLTWSDAYTKNGFIVFDTETLKYYYIENPDRYYFYLEYDDKNKTTTKLKTVNVTDSYIKIIIKNKTKGFMYNDYVNKVFGLKPADVKFIDQSLIDIQNSVNTTDIHNQSMTDLITECVDNLDNQLQQDKKEQLKRYLIELYNQASVLVE